jgi:2-phospho-L-lactate transferase/gluconeogenesis factor (CofD/UPF0052 family)/glycosyltransferase involved in cell wall biosynthesis/molybdopterin-guanine dinucleotide biosynthesis protein A
MNTYSRKEVHDRFTEEPDARLWTVIIPAAGRGSRLGYSKPKILYPILGRTILDRLIDLLEPRCSRFIFVLSPSGAGEVSPLVEKRLAGRFEIAIQTDPRGMADAINQALPQLSTPYTLVIWGDQAGISQETVRSVQKMQQSVPGAKLTLPLVERETPYVHYESDASGRFVRVLQKREGDAMPSTGESDCGVFAFETDRLREVFDQTLKQDISSGGKTGEWNFLPMLPLFETGGESVNVYHLDSPEETIGINDMNDAELLEFQQVRSGMKEPRTKLKVAMFSGGRGTGAITEALLRYPDIELTLLVNAYDDGLSTGLLRRFIPGMLGPSDIRKNISRFLRNRNDPSSQALHLLIEYRFPDTMETAEALSILKEFADFSGIAKTRSEILKARETLSLYQVKTVSRYISTFLDYYERHIGERPDFPFGDVSLGNLLFAGCYLANGQDFNQAIADFSKFAEVGDRVLNITNGENRVLVGMKENGTFLHDEASIVGPQDTSRIQEIFLLPEYLDMKTAPLGPYAIDNIRFLRNLEKIPMLNPVAGKVLRESDIIIYGPGTQYSSLFPSYLTGGVAEAIRENTRAEKVFIGNIARDYDILGEDATTLVRAFLWNMGRKVVNSVACRDLITRFFFQKPETVVPGEASHVPFTAEEFEYPLERVTWIDMEGEKGKHLGSKTVQELLHVVEGELHKRIAHVSQKVSIIVPALNEERTIRRVLQDLRDLHFSDLELDKEIIVVDGGSTDKTFELASAEPGVRAYRISGRTGRGKALRIGLAKAKGDIVVFFPSDGEYVAEDIRRVIQPLVNQEFPVVFGSRAFRTNDLSGTLKRVYGRKGLVYFISKYGGMLLSVLTLLLYGRFISDPFTSLKGFNARIFRDMRFRLIGVDFDMELIAKLARAEYVILEVPVSYKARTVEEGKKITVWDGMACLWALVRFSLEKKPKLTGTQYAKSINRYSRI